MRFWWLGAALLLAGCGGEFTVAYGEVLARVTGSETPSFGLSVLAWTSPPDSDSDECLDNGETDWCESITSATVKEVRFRATRRSDYDTYYLYVRNNHSATSTARLKVAVGETVRFDGEITLDAGEKKLIGVFDEAGRIEWKDGF